MATRKGINISGNYTVPHNYMPYSCMYFIFKQIETSDKIVFYTTLKTQRPSDTVF